MRIFLITFILIGFVFQSYAMRPPKDNNSQQPQGENPGVHSKANCQVSDARLFMNFNDVEALIEVGGSLWQDRETPPSAAYEVPAKSNNMVLYSGAIWMGGVDVNNQLKLAAILFRQGEEFWAGPLSQNVGSGNYDPSQPVGFHATRDFGAATIDPDVCIQYDKFFTIQKSEVVNYTRMWECNQDPTCNETFPISNDAIKRIKNWPAHGDVSRGQDYYLAPFYDYPSQNGAGNGVYDPSEGDIPWFDDILKRNDVQCGIDRRVTLFGDITHWWVFNDKGNIHTETGADPIGMEIHAQAFSFATNDAINRMTFYNYEMINRSTQTLYKTYFTQYADPDVGYSEDDYVGCDVSRGLGYAYNGDNFDEGQAPQPGYGDNVPAVGIDFFEGPYQDADGKDNVGPHIDTLPDGTTQLVTPGVNVALADDGIVYNGIGIGYSDGIIDNERFGMRIFSYFSRPDIAPSPAESDPTTPGDFYNYMRGVWLDNTLVYYGGSGHTGSQGVTTIPASYCFPGDTDPYDFGTLGVDPGFAWSEENIDGNGTSNKKNDRRMLQTAGPFTLTPGAVNNLTVGVVYGRSFSGNASESVDILRKNDTKAQALFDNCFKIMEPPQAPVLSVVELENKLVLLLDNPYGNNVNESYAVEDDINIPPSLNGQPIDNVYRFEGYQIYQVAGPAVGVADIGGDKARLVAQCDIKNGITKLVNYTFNAALGFSVGQVKVEGKDQGIQHSFEITEDAFTTDLLVNHKTYYYIALAYAYNNYKEYDPTDPAALDGQKIPYIASRIAANGTAIKSVAAIPHSPQPANGGTITKLQYGDSPEITTLDGRGNGGLPVELTKASMDFIVKHNSIDNPTYKSGQGPVAVKVIDPLNLVDGYFRLELDNYDDIDTAHWTLYRYASKGGELLGKVDSDTTINQKNEQLIPQWGISLSIYQNPYLCEDGGTNCYFYQKFAVPISSSVTYADSSKRWLTAVDNNATFDPSNWMMLGNTNPDPATYNPQLGLFNPKCYTIPASPYIDPHYYFDNIAEGMMTLGLVARRNTCGYTPIGIPESIGASKSTFSQMRKFALPSVYQTSVDVVITSDKSKWTRCPVIELGNDPNLNVNGGKTGLLRQSPSVDKNGKQPGDSGYNKAEANPNGTTPVGMGWFPGYAIDVETGRRLNMAFGENSFQAGENGADMLWNPTSTLFNEVGFPIMGGQHVIYVFGRIDKFDQYDKNEVPMPTYDKGQFIYEQLAKETVAAYQDVYNDLSWVIYPLLAQNQDYMATDIKISARINQQYTDYNLTGAFGGNPTYSWSMENFRTIKNNKRALADALEMINVVPNPYYAFSQYEISRLDTRVKITNLPERCEIRIYNTSGKLMRSFDKDSPITSIDWDLKNSEGISVAGGVYLIHVKVEGIGSRVIKFFGGMREPDLENF